MDFFHVCERDWGALKKSSFVKRNVKVTGIAGSLDVHFSRQGLYQKPGNLHPTRTILTSNPSGL